MDIRNYAQGVGKSSCVRCDFDTDESMSFADQDEAMRAHLEEKHPGWQTDGGASILKRRMPVSDADKIAALEQENTRLREALEATAYMMVAPGVPVSRPGIVAALRIAVKEGADGR